jgi:hypothetical protein
VVVGNNSNGQDKKMSQVQYKDTTPFELITYLKSGLGDFSAHNYGSQWQKKNSKTTYNIYLKTLWYHT